MEENKEGGNLPIGSSAMLATVNQRGVPYRVIQGSWLKGGTLYIWYRWTYLEILLAGGSHKLFFLFGIS